MEQNQRELSLAVQAMSTCSPQNQRELPVGVQARSSSRVQEVRSGCDQPVSEKFQDAESDYPAPMIPVSSVTPEEWQVMESEQPDNVMPNVELADTTVVVDVALASIMESPEGADRPSVAFSLPGGVDRRASWTDTACPVQPEASYITPEAPEGSPSPMDILPVSMGASAPTFPGGRG